MAARDSQQWPAHLHMRPRHLARVNCVAQVHIHKAGGSHIAYRSNSSQHVVRAFTTPLIASFASVSVTSL